MIIEIDKIITNSDDDLNEEILAPYEYINNLPSVNQNIRIQFLNSFNELYYKINDSDILQSINEIISIFHNSSLLIDDIEDESEYRRKSKTSHKIYGVPLTLNCGNLMYFKALKLAQDSLSNDVHLQVKINQVLIDEMLNLHHGQGLDIYWRDYLVKLTELPSIEDYLKMVKNKTGGLFRLSIKLLSLFTKEDVESYDLISIANLLGILYQIRDDYLNIVDERYSTMKGIQGEDLIEGKLSLPILHCLLSTNEIANPVHKLLYTYQSVQDRSNQAELISQCIHYMKHESNSLKFTHDLILEYEKKLKDLISKNKNFKTSSLIQIVNQLCDV